MGPNESFEKDIAKTLSLIAKELKRMNRFLEVIAKAHMFPSLEDNCDNVDEQKI